MSDTKTAGAFQALVELVRAETGWTKSQARQFLEKLADAVTLQVLTRKQRVVWPRLGTFRPFTQKPRAVQLEGLKRTGHLHAGAPPRADIERIRKLRFRPSKMHALLKGVR